MPCKSDALSDELVLQMLADDKRISQARAEDMAKAQEFFAQARERLVFLAVNSDEPFFQALGEAMTSAEHGFIKAVRLHDELRRIMPREASSFEALLVRGTPRNKALLERLVDANRGVLRQAFAFFDIGGHRTKLETLAAAL